MNVFYFVWRWQLSTILRVLHIAVAIEPFFDAVLSPDAPVSPTIWAEHYKEDHCKIIKSGVNCEIRWSCNHDGEMSVTKPLIKCASRNDKPSLKRLSPFPVRSAVPQVAVTSERSLWQSLLAVLTDVVTDHCLRMWANPRIFVVPSDKWSSECFAQLFLALIRFEVC